MWTKGQEKERKNGWLYATDYSFARQFLGQCTTTIIQISTSCLFMVFYSQGHYHLLQLVMFTRPLLTRLPFTAPWLFRMHWYLALGAAAGPHSWRLLLNQAL